MNKKVTLEITGPHKVGARRSPWRCPRAGTWLARRPRRLPGCGTELAPSFLICPSCHRLVHAETLKRLADEAERAMAAGQPQRRP